MGRVQWWRAVRTGQGWEKGSGSAAHLNTKFGDWLMEFGERTEAGPCTNRHVFCPSLGGLLSPLVVGSGLDIPESPLTPHEAQLMITKRIIHCKAVVSPL